MTNMNKTHLKMKKWDMLWEKFLVEELIDIK